MVLLDNELKEEDLYFLCIGMKKGKNFPILTKNDTIQHFYSPRKELEYFAKKIIQKVFRCRDENFSVQERIFLVHSSTVVSTIKKISKGCSKTNFV